MAKKYIIKIRKVKIMFLLDAINSRISIRKFLDVPIEKNKLTDLNELIQQYNQNPGIRFELINNETAFSTFTESYGSFENVKNFIVAIKETGNNKAEEKLGYFGELLVLHAVSFGLGTCWVGVRDNLKGLEYYDLIPDEFKNSKNPTVDLMENEEICCLIALGVTDLDLETQKSLNAKRKSKSYDEIAYTTSHSHIAPDWFKDSIAAVLKAPSVFNAQPIKFVFDNNTIFAEIVDKDVVMSNLDLGIAKLHFEIGANGGTWQWGDRGTFIKE